jgi:tRNA modification GTPase
MVQTDTIAAVGTPPGISAVAVIRISGPETDKIVRELCPGLPPDLESRRAYLTPVLNPQTGETLDQVLLTFFKGPGSYTGEDMAEVSCHGGWLSPATILVACEESGARHAEPGEFTRRAYLNGKMDLLQAEAVLDLVEARNRVLHEAAVRQLEKGLSERIGGVREGLVDLEALLVHHLDFPEEDDPPVPVGAILERASALEETMAALLRTAPEGELLKEGAVTVLAGRPNSGKSSLFNALLGEDRAIVTEGPGTTRDALEAVVSLRGYPFRLVDTAGLRESLEEVERMGVEVARRYLLRADVVLFCAEAGRDLEEEEKGFLKELAEVPVLLVRTKSDLVSGPSNGSPRGRDRAGTGPRGGESTYGEVELSARSGEGLDLLGELLPSMVFSGLVESRGEVPVLTRRRHAEGIRRAVVELKGFMEALDSGVPAEAAATHLRSAETALEEILGVIPGEEVLDRVFRQFCIGK